MVEYFIICALFGVIIVQAVMYRRERFKLYDIIRRDKSESIFPNRQADGVPSKDEPKLRGHRRAFMKWRNGGDEQ